MNFISPGGIEEAVAEVVEVEGGPVVGGSKGVMKLLTLLPPTVWVGVADAPAVGVEVLLKAPMKSVLC